MVSSGHYFVARDAAETLLKGQRQLLVADDSSESLIIRSPEETESRLEIYLDGGQFQVLVGQYVSFDEDVTAVQETEREVRFLIETAAKGFTLETWMFGGRVLVARAHSRRTGFSAQTISTFRPRWCLKKQVRLYEPYVGFRL